MYLMDFVHSAGSAEDIGELCVEAGIYSSVHIWHKVLAGRKSRSRCIENVLYRSELVSGQGPHCACTL